MTLDGAIQHYEEKASSMKSCAIAWKTTSKSCVSERVHEHSLKEYELCKEYAEEHEQLAEWLRELKAYRELFESPEEAKRTLEKLMV